MKTTEPRSLQVPPWRSTCSIRRICRKRMPLRRSVCVPTATAGPGPAPSPHRKHRAGPWGTPRSAQVTDEQTEVPRVPEASEGLCQEWNPNSAWARNLPPATLPRGSAPVAERAGSPGVPDGRGGKHLPLGAHAENDHGGHDHDEVWGGSRSALSPAGQRAQGKEPRGRAGQGPTEGTRGHLGWETLSLA